MKIVEKIVNCKQNIKYKPNDAGAKPRKGKRNSLPPDLRNPVFYLLFVDFY